MERKKKRAATAGARTRRNSNFVKSATASSHGPVMSEVVPAEVESANDGSALVVEESPSAPTAGIEEMARMMERTLEVSHDEAIIAVWIARELQHWVGE